MERLIEKRIEAWAKGKRKRALLVTGARQVGKTYSIRRVLRGLGIPFYEANFVTARKLGEELSNATDGVEMVNAIRKHSPVRLEKGKSIVFLDEVQEFPRLLSNIKFLVDEGSFSYVMSGSLLGVHFVKAASIPVGYVTEERMYPLSFLEFARAFSVTDDVIDYLRGSLLNETAVAEDIHERMMGLFRSYLAIGGMPAVVSEYLDSHDLEGAHRDQNDILTQYRADFTKYEREDRRLRVLAVYESIPSQLSKDNLKFVFNEFDSEMKFDRVENSFLWLSDAGVAYPVYDVSEIRRPLLAAKEKNSFKLFSNDVGLLMGQYPSYFKNVVLSPMSNENLGGIYENYVCEELHASGLVPYYHRTPKLGEIDFLVEIEGGIYAIEVKSGRYFKRHPSLDKLGKPPYEGRVEGRIVLSNSNLERESDGILYLPIYMIGMLPDVVREKKSSK